MKKSINKNSNKLMIDVAQHKIATLKNFKYYIDGL